MSADENERTRSRPATDAMIAAGILALDQILFEGSRVFDSDRPRIVKAVWAAMNKAAKRVG